MPEVSWEEISELKHELLEAWSAVQAMKLRIVLIEPKLKKKITYINDLITKHESEK